MNIVVPVTITIDDKDLLAIAAAMLGARPAPTPTPTPTPGPTVPLAFDEVYYLEVNGDVAEAVREGFFTSGYDHYVKHGKAEGRAPVRPATVPPPVPTPVPLPAPTWTPAASYPTVGALVSDLTAHRFDTSVFVDGASVHVGFGPGMNYYRQPDGTVGTVKWSSPGRKPGDMLLPSYPSLKALMADAEEVRWNWAITVDGEAVRGGFEADNGASHYVTKGGALVRK